MCSSYYQNIQRVCGTLVSIIYGHKTSTFCVAGLQNAEQYFLHIYYTEFNIN